jgi:hypothetical protein
MDMNWGDLVREEVDKDLQTKKAELQKLESGSSGLTMAFGSVSSIGPKNTAAAASTFSGKCGSETRQPTAR